jgi:hypothetical protein
MYLTRYILFVHVKIYSRPLVKYTLFDFFRKHISLIQSNECSIRHECSKVCRTPMTPGPWILSGNEIVSCAKEKEKKSSLTR